MTTTVLLARKGCAKQRRDGESTACVRAKGSKDELPIPELTAEDFAAVVVGLLVLLAVGWSLLKLAGRRRRRKVAQEMQASGDWLPIGEIIHSPHSATGDLGWWSTIDNSASIPTERVNLHVLVGGATGSGKSTTVDTIECAVAATYRPQIIHFDCKGRRGGAERFFALMLRHGYSEDAIRVAPLEPYDGWRGDERAHYNRLLEIQDFTERYYESGTKDLMHHVVSDDDRPPQMSTEVIERLTRARPGVELDPKVVTGAITRYRGFFRSLGSMLDGSWAFEDVDAAYIELPGMARREDATAFGRYLLQDFQHYIAERKDISREVLLVLDDFSAISQGDAAVNLVERAREFNVGVVLTTQSYSGLGPGADRIVDACNGAIIVHRMANPEPFTSRAGTVMREATTVTQLANPPNLLGQLMGLKPDEPRTSTRQVEVPRIDPNEVRGLPPGQAFVIADGRAQRMAIHTVHQVGLGLDVARVTLNRRKKLDDSRRPPGPTPPTPPDPDLDF